MQRVNGKAQLPLDHEGCSKVCGNMIYNDEQTRALLASRGHEQRPYWWCVCEGKRLAEDLCRLCKPLLLRANVERHDKTVCRQNDLAHTSLVHCVRGAQHRLTPNEQL